MIYEYVLKEGMLTLEERGYSIYVHLRIDGKMHLSDYRIFQRLAVAPFLTGKGVFAELEEGHNPSITRLLEKFHFRHVHSTLWTLQC